MKVENIEFEKLTKRKGKRKKQQKKSHKAEVINQILRN